MYHFQVRFCKEGEQLENYTKYKLKADEELAQILEGRDNLFVISCNKCFKEFDTMHEPDQDMFLELAQKLGKTVTGTAKADFLCNKTKAEKGLAAMIPEGTDNIVVISCGLGIQTVADVSQMSVIAAANSLNYTGHHGMALTKKACDACAQCYLNMTGGICPIVDCSKSLINGQCGGAKNGKCEVSPDKDCAWEKIQQRLAKQGRLSELTAQSVQVRDYSKVNFKVINDYVKSIRETRLEGWYGGIHPVEGKEPTEHKPLVRFPAPETVVIPLSMHLGAPANAIVNVGDYVKMGQKIGEASGFISAPVHASVSGKVLAIQDLPHATRGTCTAIVIENDGKDLLDESIKPNKPLDELTPAEIIEIVKEAGIVGMGGAGFPTYVKLNPGKPIDAVLVNACECEPMLTADHRVLLEFADDIIFGLQAEMKTVAAPKGIIVIEENKPDAIALLREKTADIDGIEVLEVATQYPQGGEKMLIKRAMGRSVPSGKLPADVGACVSNVSTVKAIADAIKTGMPLIERVTTVTGKHIPTPQNFIVRVGTSAAELVEACGGISGENVTIKAGGPMMGFPQTSLYTPIMKGSNGIIAIDTDVSEAQNCIKCGRCVDVCPMDLKPLYFYKYAISSDWEGCKEKNIMDCMECRCCEYICSSKLPLVSMIKMGKNGVRGLK
ncbi:MAG: electron transport complex subunit RsxC [Ruminococcaceae bacterium]|nr:electron transport complex subunit RsxC [Oscillospiraceae bacterium]